MNLPQWLKATIHPDPETAHDDEKSGYKKSGGRKWVRLKALSRKGFRRLYPLYPPKNSHPEKHSQPFRQRLATSLRLATLPPASSPPW
ncbi:hypothetical protein PWG14_18600 (plasmid) [Chromobacterium amazonense]|uniref:hypothetical protein n=1 Tax=Chromobacterium amazonense TaxID=1382803 RepID=UPI00237DAE2A|nr:hypothetical protein [Chromobacterium amazonense]MDE1714516.1 hypothetical protein [Chromobacterium amazonense]